METNTNDYLLKYVRKPVNTTGGNILQRDKPVVQLVDGRSTVLYPIFTPEGEDTGLRVDTLM